MTRRNNQGSVEMKTRIKKDRNINYEKLLIKFDESCSRTMQISREQIKHVSFPAAEKHETLNLLMNTFYIFDFRKSFSVGSLINVLIGCSVQLLQ